MTQTADGKQTVRHNRALGQYGEELAADHLEAQGCQILERNWRCSLGELDIIALDGDTLIGVEVKTRQSLSYGHPLEAITPTKAARLRSLLMQWLSEQPNSYPNVRIDAIAITSQTGGLDELLHVEAIA